MSVYNLRGESLQLIYGKTGGQLQYAYGINGDVIYSSSPPPEPNFTIMTYNPQWFTGSNAKSAMLQELFSTYDADVIGIQEYPKSGVLPSVAEQALTNYPYRYVTPSSAPNFNPNALLIKEPFDSVENIVFEAYGADGPGSYQYQKGIITFDSKRVAIYNAHLAWRNDSSDTEVRRLQSEELFADMETEQYSIAVGDFNAYCHSEQDIDYINIFKKFYDSGYNLSNCSRPSGFKGTYAGTYHDENMILAYGNPCDVIITSGNIALVESIIDFTKLKYVESSTENLDHLPVVAKLKI